MLKNDYLIIYSNIIQLIDMQSRLLDADIFSSHNKIKT
jgi:hypothetical protein